MKITLCGSIAFYRKMEEVKLELEKLGHEVKLPPSHIKDDNGDLIEVVQYYKKRKEETSETGWIWERKKEAMIMHFEKVEWSDAILVLNYDKNGIEGYIGANTFLEMGLAMYQKKKIFLLNKIPQISYKEEILGMFPIVINNGDIQSFFRKA